MVFTVREGLKILVSTVQFRPCPPFYLNKISHLQPRTNAFPDGERDRVAKVVAIRTMKGVPPFTKDVSRALRNTLTTFGW